MERERRGEGGSCYFGGVVVFEIFSLYRLGIYRWWRELYGREGGNLNGPLGALDLEGSIPNCGSEFHYYPCSDSGKGM